MTNLTYIAWAFLAFNVLTAVAIAAVFFRALVPAYKNSLKAHQDSLTAIDSLTRSVNTSAFVNTELARITKSAEVAIVEIPELLRDAADSLQYLSTAQRHELQRAGRKHQF